MKKSILQKVLAVMARWTMRRYRPMVIGVTGSVGKTSARMAIHAALKKKFRCRTAEKNYNNEIGMALTILGLPHYGRNVLGWLYGLIRANKRIVWRGLYPEILVLEYGVDRPGDMDYLLSLARPDIAVVTAIGEIPAHVEFFENADRVWREKAKLVEALSPDGCAILNRDDAPVYRMKARTKARTAVTYGEGEDADVRVANYEVRMAQGGAFGSMPIGIGFKLEHKGSVVPVRMSGVFGRPHATAAAAAAAVALTLKINLVEIAEALREYAPAPGRMRLIRGIAGSLILDDTYNASPEAVRSALQTLHDLPTGKRKIAVLGDMLEIGAYAEQAHRAVGRLAADFLDILVSVGERASFIADEAAARGIESGRIMRYGDSRSAGRALASFLQEGDLVLVKGSQGVRMERIVEVIMAEPQRAGELLARQDPEWKQK